jgi:general secretion pathway protein M
MTLRTWWQVRSAQEKRMLKVAVFVLVLGTIWVAGIAPALKTIKTFEVTRNSQDVQLQAMLRLQSQAQNLRAVPQLGAEAAQQALHTSVTQAFGGRADFQAIGSTATITLKGVEPQALAQWLTVARTNARSAPQQAHLSYDKHGWSGTLQMSLPAPDR